MVCAIDIFVPRLPKAEDLAFGEYEEKAVWLTEIAQEIDARKKSELAMARSALLRRIGHTVDEAMEALSDDGLSNQAIEEIHGHAQRLFREIQRVRCDRLDGRP